jgi:hypothetical protein
MIRSNESSGKFRRSAVPCETFNPFLQAESTASEDGSIP